MSTNQGFGQPLVSSVTGQVVHDNLIVIEGSGFGAKSPARPLWWDDGEGATLNDPSIMRTGDFDWVTSRLGSGSRHYNDVWPRNTTDLSTRIQYRPATFRNTAPPHGRSNVFLAGAHDDEGECMGGSPGRNVAINISDSSVHDDWIIFYYQRLDALWPTTNPGSQNYKYFNWEADAPYGIYDSLINYDNTNSCGGGYNNLRRTPACNEDWMTGAIIGVLDFNTCGGAAGYPVITHDTNVPNPLKKWVHTEVRMDYTGDFYQIINDNVAMVDTELDAEGDCDVRPAVGVSPWGGVSIGGYWRENLCNNQADLNDDAVRYFDDIYVDTTLSRVVLANQPSYSSATIIEPQIPSAWSNTSISVDVNLGRLQDSGGAYLFVFDSGNLRNSIGFPVELGGVDHGGDNIPPSAPPGFRVRTEDNN